MTEGRFKGAKLLGEATLDQSTKRVDVTFTILRPAGSKSVYSMTGVLMSDDGVMGLEGEYESNYWSYFFASALTNALSGYSQSTVATTQTAFGPYGAVPSADTFAKSGVAAGLSDSSNKLRDRMNSAPEKTTVRGPIFVKITVM